MKRSCCKRYKHKGKACKKCPSFAGLSSKEIKKLRKNAKHSQ